MAQSRVDAKTGLLNAPTWEAEAEAELSRAARTRQPLSIALADIDHFKSVNDTHGHLAGDRVLKALGNALTTQSRGYDRVGRFGGEEFVLLLARPPRLRRPRSPSGCEPSSRTCQSASVSARTPRSSK
jgi:diguanylate cyclase (GGDEF)-like protein